MPFLLSSHYRRSINYTLDNMNQSKANYQKLVSTMRKIHEMEPSGEETHLVERVKEARDAFFEAMDRDFDTPVAIAELMSLFRDLNREILEEGASITKDFKEAFFAFIRDVDRVLGIFPNLDQVLELGIHRPLEDKEVLLEAVLELLRKTQQALEDASVALPGELIERHGDVLERARQGKEAPLEIPEDLDVLLDEAVSAIKDVRSKLREEKMYDLSDEIREKLRDLGIPVEDQ